MPHSPAQITSSALQQRQQSMKQRTIEPWERHVASLAASAMGLTNPIIFHPSWMHRVLYPAWLDRMPMAQFSRWVLPKALPQLPLPDGMKLPERFIAVRVYGRATMEANDGIMLTLKLTLLKFAKKQPLVLLTSDKRYDDHADLVRPFGPNMADVSGHLTVTTNLSVQAAVIQRSTLFIGTYGGLVPRLP